MLMHFNKPIKTSAALKIQSAANNDHIGYLAEIKQASPVGTVEETAEIAEIPHGLGRSERFKNKAMIYEVLEGLACVKEKKEIVLEESRNDKLGGTVDFGHILHRKAITPFSPGVVRIKPKEQSQYFKIETIKKIRPSAFRELNRSFIIPNCHSVVPPCTRNPVKTLKNCSFSTKFTAKTEFSSKITGTTSLSPKNSTFSTNPRFQRSMLLTFLPTPQHQVFIPASTSPSATETPLSKEGYTELTYPNGDIYKGSFKNDKKEGKGSFYYSKYKVKYKGDFKQDLWWGAGSLIFRSGDMITGTWTKGNLTDGRAKIKYSSNGEYDGNIKDGKRSGIGVMTYEGRGSYKGHWDNDQRSGYGLIRNDSMFFEGIFKADYTDGPGVLVLKDAAGVDSGLSSENSAVFSMSIEKRLFLEEMLQFPQFQVMSLMEDDVVFMTLTSKSVQIEAGRAGKNGRFISGRLNGSGVGMYGMFGVYYGEFVHGKKSGWGKMIYKDHEHQCKWLAETVGEYLGEWKDDCRHGQGEMIWPCGTKYAGHYKHDRRHHVTGKLFFMNGDVYEGGWVDDLMEGSCTIYKKEGLIIKGQCIAGVLQKFAQVEYQDGRVYKGDLASNIPNGIGKMRWSNGNEYSGGFIQGVLSGFGRMNYNNGDIYEGAWETNRRTGKGVMIYSSLRQKYEGEWIDDKRTGQGQLKTLKGELIFSGAWSADERIV